MTINLAFEGEFLGNQLNHYDILESRQKDISNENIQELLNEAIKLPSLKLAVAEVLTYIPLLVGFEGVKEDLESLVRNESEAHSSVNDNP